MAEKPKFENAPGIVVEAKPNDQWEARWKCRTDLRSRGFRPKTVRLWKGVEPTENQRLFVSEQCQWYQNEMLIFGRGGLPALAKFDGTLASLVFCYQTDAQSSYRKLRYHGRMGQDRKAARLVREYGKTEIALINARMVLDWYQAWLGPDGTHVAMAHAMVTLLRTLCSFGKTILEDPECKRVRDDILRELKFEQSKAPPQWMTAEQAIAIRRSAHAMGWHSIALAEALQFELILRQKYVIGEWVPDYEPGISDVTSGSDKWLRGLRWSEIDGMILRHVTSKKQKPIVVDLRLSEMVMEEFEFIKSLARACGKPAELPRSGPMIINEYSNEPFVADEFRRKFRIVARAAGVPDEVKNMDSRAGGITEATDAGAPLEHVRHAATHSDVAMTQRYSRGGADKTENVQRIRLAHRNKGAKNEE